MGPFQAQFFVSMLVIAGGACFALICDFLINEELRGLIVRVKARRGEQQRLAGILMPQDVRKQAAPKQRSAAPPETGTNQRKRTANADALAAIKRGEARADMRSAPGTRDPVTKDWRSMFGRHGGGTTAAAAILPQGFHDRSVLRKLVESRSPVTGLVVLIRVNESSESVRGLVKSLIGPSDFAARNREDEYVLIYPEEQGAPAQHKLSEIAERCRIFNCVFWDRSKSCFRWGGIEVRGEPIDEAIASAAERMNSGAGGATDPVCRDGRFFPKL